MERGLVTLIGMSIAYLASFLGLALAWWSWRRHHRDNDGAEGSTERSADPSGERR